jgi:D-tyrosyl-tRNA(Tyr) deacylase
MKAVIQRVGYAKLSINQSVFSNIGKGLFVLLGITKDDTPEDIKWLGNKIRQLRIFEDDIGKMNLSVEDVTGELLIVSQFTLHASIKKGNRPSFINAAKPDIAIPLYNQFIEFMQKNTDVQIKTGSFGAMMNIELINEGPVTIIMDSKNRE